MSCAASLAQDLDGYGLVDEDVAGFVDHAHTALTQPRLDGVAAIDGRVQDRILDGLLPPAPAGKGEPSRGQNSSTSGYLI